MVNEIQQVRETLQAEWEQAQVCPQERYTEVSPCGRYELEIDCYTTASQPDYPSLARAVVRSTETGKVLATVKRNDDRCFYAWVTRDGHDYLLLPEDLEGQTVIDLTSGRIEGFATTAGGFIWCRIHPSSDHSKLAVEGCYWAGPFQVIVYDFRDPLNLPLPEMAEFDLPGQDAVGAWLSANSFSVVLEEGGIRVIELPPTLPDANLP